MDQAGLLVTVDVERFDDAPEPEPLAAREPESLLLDAPDDPAPEPLDVVAPDEPESPDVDDSEPLLESEFDELDSDVPASAVAAAADFLARDERLSVL